MTTENLIISDYNDLKRYFNKKFELLELSIVEENNYAQQAYDSDAILPDDSFARLSHFIKPDMVINTYAYFEFWVEKLVKIKKEKNVPFVDALQTCLKNQYQINTEELSEIFDSLKILSMIRNIYIHRGGHPNENETEILKEQNILDSGNMVILSKQQIFEWIDNAKVILIYIKKNIPKSV